MDAKVRQRTLRMLSNGMYIITARSSGRFGAATITWLSQASFKPPLLMTAIRKDSNVFACISETGVAAVHILDHEQQGLAQKFFAPTKVESNLINGKPFVAGKTSCPILENALAYVECELHEIVNNQGDHAVVIMEVIEAECRAELRRLTIADSRWEYGG